MLQYFYNFYIRMDFGIGFILTEIFFAAGIVLCFHRVRKNRKDLLETAGRIGATWLCSVLLSSVYYWIFGLDHLNNIVMLILIALAAALTREYEPMLRVVRGTVYYTCYYQILAISEPIAPLLKSVLTSDQRWPESVTWIAVVVFVMVIVWMINRWSLEDMTFVPAWPVALTEMSSVLGIMLQVAANRMDTEHPYRLLVAAAFLILEMSGYYTFYKVGCESRRNVAETAMSHHEQRNREMYETLQQNLDSLHEIRHEIRHHLAYIRVLMAREEYDKLFDYTNSVLGEAEEMFSAQQEWGNDVVDAAVGHAMKKAEEQGIAMETQIVVPQQLPFRETDFYSLLSNLLENAVEGAAGSSESDRVVTVSIGPRQDYLFIRVTNPVDGSLSRKRMLSLRTTKKDPALHGYGTRVIGRIAEKYQGSFLTDVHDGRFIADVMLDLNVDN